MTRLSINLNKVALIRNSRGRNYPDLVKVAMDCEAFGAQGITIHPRPDERHARFDDVFALKEVVKTELNIEGYPTERFMKTVLEAKPHQVTLVPDAPNAITSNAGWDTLKHHAFLSEIIAELKGAGIRTSIFLNAEPNLVEPAKKTGTHRIELYTEPYAENYSTNKEIAILPFIETAKEAAKVGLGLNAGHDLNLLNLQYFHENIPNLEEVSIGHALISNALYYGLENVVGMYLRCLK